MPHLLLSWLPYHNDHHMHPHRFNHQQQSHSFYPEDVKRHSASFCTPTCVWNICSIGQYRRESSFYGRFDRRPEWRVKVLWRLWLLLDYYDMSHMPYDFYSSTWLWSFRPLRRSSTWIGRSTLNDWATRRKIGWRACSFWGHGYSWGSLG